MSRFGSLIVGVAFVFASGSAIVDDDSKWLPNTKITPGAIAETRAAVIRVHGKAKAHRVWHDQIGTLAK